MEAEHPTPAHAPASAAAAQDNTTPAPPADQLAQHSPAQTPASAAAAQDDAPPVVLEHEESWRLLLQNLMHPDAEMFCHVYDISREKFIGNLLATSSTMADLVYKACEGELRFSMSLFQLPRCVSAGNWLASHARLLRELAVYGPPSDGPEVEAAVAAGLQAASGRSSAADPLPDAALRPRSRWHFLRFKPKQQQQLCAQQPQQPQQQQQGAHAPSLLLLRKMHMQAPCSGRILSALAGSKHLTALSVSMRALDDVAASQEALRSLTELRELELDLSSERSVSWPHPQAPTPGGPPVLEGLAPPLQSLSQLTRLQLRCAAITQANLACFPASLQSLTLQLAEGNRWADPSSISPAPLDFSRLSALTALDIPRVLEGDVLPPGLRSLVLPHGFESLHPIVELTCLESLISCSIPAAEQLQELRGLGTLREVSLGGGRSGWEVGADASQLVRHLAALPLVSIQLRLAPPALVDNIWQWTKLQRLHLEEVHIVGSFAGLSEQLLVLPQLEYLRMRGVTACRGAAAWMYRELPAHERVADLQVLLRACARMPSLRRLWFDQVYIDSAARALSDATQLRSIVLTSCGVQEVTAELLRAALPVATELSVSEL